MSRMIVRAAVKEDLEGIRIIYNHSIVNTTAVYHFEPFSQKKMEDWFAAKEVANFPIILAIKEDKIIGFVTYGNFRPWPGFLHTVEHSIHIHPNFMSKGVASKLMEAIIDTAKSQQKHVLIGGVDATNAASIRLHKKFGFENAGTLKQVGRKFDQWLDLSFMQLILS